jgi:hypothetical protein
MTDDSASSNMPDIEPERVDGEPDMAEVAAPPHPRRRWGVWLAAGLLSAVLVALGVTGYLAWSELRQELDEQTQELQSTIDTQAGQLAALNAQLDSLSRQVGRVDSALASLRIPPDFTPQVLGLQRDVASAVSQLGTLGGEVASLTWEIDDVKSCVNTYMDTIGRWSSNIFTYYNYYYC